MKFVLLRLSGQDPEWLKRAAADYTAKINPLITFEIQSIPSPKHTRDQASAKLAEESRLIERALKPDDDLILFDERGKSLDSRAFAKVINEILNSGKKRAIFLIGGAYGVDPKIAEKARRKISLAPFVMNHHVAEVVALEQIYRAMTILKNLPYHNE